MATTSFASMDLPTWLTRLMPKGAISLLLFIVVVYIISSTIASIYSVFFGPLSKYPGPKLRAYSVFPKAWSIFIGNEAGAYPAIHEKYGPIVRVSPNELSFIGNAQTFKDIYGFRKGPGEVQPFKDPLMVGKPLNGVHTLLTMDDAEHSRVRKILSNAFADRSIKELEPMLKQWMEKMVSKLNECATTVGKADMLKYYNCTTFDVMADLCFNEPLYMLENGEFSPWVTSIFQSLKEITVPRAIKWLGAPMRWLIDDVVFRLPAVRARAHEHWRYSADRVNKRLTFTPSRRDLWSQILDKSKGADTLALIDHHAAAVLFMGAGTETSATALSGTLYNLLKNPAKLAKLTAEIRSTFSSIDDFTLDGLSRCEYLRAALNEGMRMYPPVPIALARRTPMGGSTIAGHHIPANVAVGIPQLATYYSAENFAKPHEYHPERWLVGSEENRAGGFADDHLGALEPFSVGPRNCLGKNLAWHEIRLLMAATLLRFDLELCDESRQWAESQKVYVLWEKKPLIVRLTPVKTQ